MENIIFYGLILGLIIVSYFKSPQKTKKAFIKGWKAFSKLIPQLLGLVTAVGIIIAVLNPRVISKIIGESSGWIGVFLASVIGSISLIPGFVAFPTSEMLIKNGAGYMQIAAFISSLMMVGIVTLPLEIKYLGKKVSLFRNILSFFFAFIVAYIIGRII